MNLKVVIEEGGGQGTGFNLLLYSDHERLPPLFLAYFMAFFQRSAPMEINSISTLISNVRDTPWQYTRGSFFGVSLDDCS